MAKAPRWNLKDDQFLRKYHGVLSGEEIARRLNRSMKACGVRASRLGLKSSRRGRTARDAAQELGVSIPTVIRWITLKLLEAKRRESYDEKKRPLWFEIQDEAIRHFLETHYLLYNPSLLVKRWKACVPYNKIAQWISIKKASGQYGHSYPWFYRRVRNGKVRAQKGFGEFGYTTYLWREDIESAKQRRVEKDAPREPKRIVLKGTSFSLQYLDSWIRVQTFRRTAFARAHRFLSLRYEVHVEVTGQSMLVMTPDQKGLRKALSRVGNVA